MTKHMQHLSVMLVAITMLAAPIDAQQPTGDAAPKSASPRASFGLQVQFVLSTYQNEKKISSRPYTVLVSGADVAKGSLRLGTDVPYSSTTQASSGSSDGTKPQRSFSYRSVGTQIDCLAEAIDGGRFRVDVTVSDSSIQKNRDSQIEAPVFPTFTIRGGLVMKDGQTSQLSSSTDPVSGEVMKVDVTLTVMK